MIGWPHNNISGQNQIAPWKIPLNVFSSQFVIPLGHSIWGDLKLI